MTSVNAKTKILLAVILATVAACDAGPDDAKDAPGAAAPTPVSAEIAPRPPLPEPAPNGGDRVVISPAASGGPRFEFDPKSGRTVLQSTDLKSLFRYAYDVSTKKMDFAVPIDLSQRFDVVIEPARPSVVHAKNALRQRLEADYNLETVRETRVVPVFFLERIEGADELPPSTSPHRQIRNLDGRFEGRRVTGRDLAHFLTLISYKPVVDRTGSRDPYDLVLTWDARGGTKAVHEALAQPGFELVPGEDSVVYLVFRRAAPGGTPPLSE